MNPQFISALQNVILILQCITLVASVIALIIALGRNVQKPNKIQNDRITELEEWRKQVDSCLEQGNSHFDSIDEGNTVMQNSMLAIMAAIADMRSRVFLPTSKKRPKITILIVKLKNITDGINKIKSCMRNVKNDIQNLRDRSYYL